MVLEIAAVEIRAGTEDNFVAAYGTARQALLT
jgi:hypothetical protein